MSRKKFKNKQRNLEFANILISLRENRGIKSQKAIGAILGIDRNRIQRIESGHELYIGEAMAYADWLSVSLDSLLGRDEKPSLQTDDFKDFLEIVKDLAVIIKNEKRRSTVEALRGWLRDMAKIELQRMRPSPGTKADPRRKEVETILKKMSRRKY